MEMCFTQLTRELVKSEAIIWQANFLSSTVAPKSQFHNLIIVTLLQTGPWF